jgi:hypothetical protein
MKRPEASANVTPAQRSAAKRTALLFGLIAFAVYATFVISGVIGR